MCTKVLVITPFQLLLEVRSMKWTGTFAEKWHPCEKNKAIKEFALLQILHPFLQGSPSQTLPASMCGGSAALEGSGCERGNEQEVSCSRDRNMLKRVRALLTQGTSLLGLYGTFG